MFKRIKNIYEGSQNNVLFYIALTLFYIAHRLRIYECINFIKCFKRNNK